MGDGDVFDSLAVEVLFEFLHWHGELLSNAAFGLTVGPVQASAGKLYHLCARAKSHSTGILPVSAGWKPALHDRQDACPYAPTRLMESLHAVICAHWDHDWDGAVVGQPSRLSARASRPRRILGRDAPAAGGTAAPLWCRSWRGNTSKILT